MSHTDPSSLPRSDREPSSGAPGRAQQPSDGQSSYRQASYGQEPQGAPLGPELERQLVAAAHWSPIASVLLGGMTFFGPLVVLLVGGGRSRAVRAHAVDALNFQITVWILTLAVVVVSLPLMIVLVGFVTIWLAAVIPIAALAVHGLAAMRVAAGEDYRYPLAIRFIR